MRPPNGKIRLDITFHVDDPRDLAIIKVLMKVDPRRRTRKLKALAHDGILAQGGPVKLRSRHGLMQAEEDEEGTESLAPPAPGQATPAQDEYEPEIGDPAEFLDMIAKQASFFESK